MAYKEIKLDSAGAKALQNSWNAVMAKPKSTKSKKEPTKKQAKKSK